MKRTRSKVLALVCIFLVGCQHGPLEKEEIAEEQDLVALSDELEVAEDSESLEPTETESAETEVAYTPGAESADLPPLGSAPPEPPATPSLEDLESQQLAELETAPQEIAEPEPPKALLKMPKLPERPKTTESIAEAPSTEPEPPIVNEGTQTAATDLDTLFEEDDDSADEPNPIAAEPPPHPPEPETEVALVQRPTPEPQTESRLEPTTIAATESLSPPPPPPTEPPPEREPSPQATIAQREPGNTEFPGNFLGGLGLGLIAAAGFQVLNQMRKKRGRSSIEATAF